MERTGPGDETGGILRVAIRREELQTQIVIGQLAAAWRGSSMVAPNVTRR